MPHRTLDEYLKQTTPTTTKQPATKPKYRITGFYKETQFQETQIGKIPKQWKIVKLGSLFTFRNGKRPSRILENDMVPIYGANGIMGYTNTALLDRDYVIIIGRVGASGKVHLAGGKIWVRDNAIYGELYDRNRIYPVFAYFFLSFINLERYASKTTHPIIKQSFLKELEIPLPPLEEQWGIAEVLSSVDEAIEATERLIKGLERLKWGLMQELLAKGIGHSEYKQTPIGKIPKEWQVVKLQNVIIKSIGGGTPSTKNPRYWDGDIPWMTSVGIPEDDIYITKGERFITEEGFKNSATNIIPKGSLIVATRVGLGKAGVNLIDIAINQDLVGIILDKKQIIPEFIAYYLRSPKALTHIVAAARGTTIKGISRQALFNIRVPLPPLVEQRNIVNILITFDKWIKLEKKRKEKLERLKHGLMGLLLTGRVRIRVESVSFG